MSLKYLRELTEKLISANCDNPPCIDFKSVAKELKDSILKTAKNEAVSLSKDICKEEAKAVEESLQNG